MAGIAASRLNKRVTIEAESREPNGQGGFTTGWAPIATTPTVWAEIIGLSGNEALAAGIQRNVQQWRVLIRRRDDVTTKHRLKHGARIMNIKSVMPDPNSDDGTLMICESVASPQPAP